MALRRVLVATRGEAARRIVRACREENIEPVSLATSADEAERFVPAARRTVAAPPGIALDDLEPGDFVRLAGEAGCDAIHPGFGIVAENPDVAAAFEDTRMQWVGPPADLVAALAEPETAIALMSDFGLPIATEDVAPAVRFVDIPVFADPEGQVVHFAEQCCTASAHEFALIEEAPGDQLSLRLRTRLAAAAVLAARCLGYVSAGTLRFQVGPDDRFGFVAMTPRLQGGHAVAEEMTGIDLVRLQLRIAGGEASGLAQEHIRPRGHIVSVRIHVGGRDSRPLTTYREPSGHGIRVESALQAGTRVSWPLTPAVRLVVSAPDRAAAVLRVQDALDRFVIAGAPTDLGVLQSIAQSREFWHRETVAAAGGPGTAKWLDTGEGEPGIREFEGSTIAAAALQYR